jgi:hypothetical protein
MFRQFLFGGAVSLVNIAIHSMIMATVVGLARRAGTTKRVHPSLFLAVLMVPIVAVLMASHALEVIVWSWSYALVDAAPDGANLVYFAFVNYTTLGYGDVVPVEAWRLLGPITAMNGVLMFGWSTAVIFEILRRAIERGSIASTVP